MKEAIITIVDTDVVDGVSYPCTMVFRVEFEGEFAEARSTAGDYIVTLTKVDSVNRMINEGNEGNEGNDD